MSQKLFSLYILAETKSPANHYYSKDKFSSRQIDDIFLDFFFQTKTGFYIFMKTVSTGDNLLETSKPVYWEIRKIFQNVC